VITLGKLWGMFGAIVGNLGEAFGVTLGKLWDIFGAVWGNFGKALG
jgi:hypothetical protein